MIKRSLDLAFAALLLLMLSPILALISFLVFLIIGSPILFKQSRPGLNEKLFTLYKFRSMSNLRDSKGNLMSDRLRLGKLGIFLRRYSLDELPQLWNIMIGDMSFVGPRPLLKDYIPLYSANQKKRHLIRPGITGLAQVRGRNNISWRRKFKYDLFYLKNRSISLDLKILWLTFLVAGSGRGVSKDHFVTTDYFNGSN